MTVWEIVFLAAALAMDAFAVSICKGVALPRLRGRHAVTVGFYFGGFQALMPVMGYFLGSLFGAFVDSVDHWIACVILVAIGVKAIVETFRGEDEDEEPASSDESAQVILRPASMLMLAVATSIDAFAVGITLAFRQVSIAFPATLIGAITFALSAVGVWIGHRFGARFDKDAERFGGMILIMLGIRILVQHFAG